MLDNINIEDEYSYDIESINDVPVDNYTNEHIPENSHNDLSDDSQFPIDSMFDSSFKLRYIWFIKFSLPTYRLIVHKGYR